MDLLGDTLAGLQAFAIDMAGMKVKIYHPHEETLADGNIVPDEVTPAGECTAEFQFSKQAQDQAQAMGIFGLQSAMAIVPGSGEALIRLRACLVDAKKRVWLVRSPATTPEIGVITLSAAYLVTRIDPDNLPDGITL